MFGKSFRLTMIVGSLLVSLLATGHALVQSAQPCQFNSGAPASCLHITLSPATLGGDFYLDGNLTGFSGSSEILIQKNSGGNTVLLEVRNIQDAASSWDGSLYVYQVMSRHVTFPPLGQTLSLTLTPRKSYIQGIVDVACDLRLYAGEDVNCPVSLDGVGAGYIPAAQTARFYLEPGRHTFEVGLGGSQASLWSPGTQSKSITIMAGPTPWKVVTTFLKVGHLVVKLDQPTAIGDFYVDGVLLGTQVAGIEQWVTPNVAHKIEVKNLADPASLNAYVWTNTARTVWPSPGSEQTVTLRLKKAGRWIVPLSYRFPNGTWTEGAHSYTLIVQCGPNSILNTNTTVNLNAESAASLYTGDVFLRRDGPATHPIFGELLGAIDPLQKTVASVYYKGFLGKEDAQVFLTNFRNACTATVAWDNNPPQPLSPGTIYQYR